MIRANRLMLVPLLLLLAQPVWAAEHGVPLRLTLPEAVALALTDNPDYALTRNRQQSAAVDVEAARGRFLPSLEGSAGGSDSFRHQAAPGEPDSYQSANLKLAAGLNLFNGFADASGLEASRQQLQAADADLLRQQQTVAVTVAASFIAVLSDRELVQVAQQNLQSQHDLETQVDAFYQAGVRSVTDLYQQQATTAQAQFGLLDAQRNLQVDRLKLLQVLGRTLGTDIEILPPDGRALENALQHLDPGETYRQALVARPDLLAQQRRIAAAREQTRAARAGYLPSLDLQASSGTSYLSSDRGNFGDQFDDNRGSSLGLTLSIPLFDRNQTRSSVAQARIGEADAAINLLKLQQQVGLEVGQALADYQRAGQQLTTTIRQLDYARQALAASEARYQVGATTWIELSSARSAFVQAQGNEVRARYDLLLQGLNIGYARGDLAALLILLTDKENPS